MFVDGVGDNSTINATARNVTASGSPLVSTGVLYINAPGPGSNSNFDISDSNITAGTMPDNHGIVTQAGNPTGSASSIIRNTRITVTAGATTGRGVITIAAGTGNATSVFDGGSITYAAEAAALATYSTGGNVSVTTLNGGTITTTGAGAKAIEAVAGGAGTVLVDNADSLVTSGLSALAIEARTANGGITVTNSGTIRTLGDGAHGIHADISGVSTSAIQVTNSNTIETSGAGAHGISGLSTDGPTTINNSGTIQTNGSFSDGINVVTNNGAIVITNTVGLAANGIGGAGIRTQSLNGAQSVTNSGAITTTGDVGEGIALVSTNGPIALANLGAIRTTGTGAAKGIVASSTGVGNVDIGNSGAITTQGDSADAIFANSAGNIILVNSGVLNTVGQTARGIDVFSSGAGTVDVRSSGSITTAGPVFAGGVLVNTAGARITTDLSGSITTVGTSSPAIELISTRNAEGLASNLLYYHDGTARIGAGSNAVSLWAGGGGTGSGEVRIGANAVVDASRGLSGVQNLMPDDGLVVIAQGARILGGSTEGVAMLNARATLDTSGDIGAMSDVAIANGSFVNAAERIDITNQAAGLLTGVVRLGDGANTLTNAGQWNVRRFYDSDGNGTRDTLAVAVADFGSSGSNTVNNTGTLALLTHDGTATTLDQTGMYLPFGNTANTLVLHSPAQGQLLGVQTFNHSGVIDLQANPSAGDVLVISGGHTAGTDGGGVFISNGGTLKIDTVLNDGGANAISDVLVVDSTLLGSGPTGIAVNNLGGTGAQTVADGIPVVEVLNKSASAAGVFALAGRAVAGPFDYLLFQGGSAANGGNAADGNWYLRSELQPCEVTNTCPPPPEPPQPPVPPVPPVPFDCTVTHSCPVPIIRPEVGAYLGNQVIALGLFRHTLHDRLGEVDFSERQRQTEGGHGAGWMRVEGNQFDSTAGRNQIDVGTDSSLVQLGAEWDRWSQGDQRLHLGVMGGWGHATTDAASSLTGYRAKGTVQGYTLGVYGTWYQSAKDATGLYLDGWLQYGDYRNKVQGDFLPQERYDSTAWAASLEAGYAFEVGRGERSAYFIEPQAQVIVGEYDADDHVEANGTVVKTSDGSGVTTRVGARFYARPLNDSHNRAQPFVEANWWHHGDDTAIAFNGAVQPLHTPNDTYELKVGAQVELGRRWTGWGQMGLRGGDGDYRNVEGLVGVKYGW